MSDPTCETLDRIFLSLKSQFANFEYEKEFAFIRTEQQIDKITKEAEIDNSIILYTIVEKRRNILLIKVTNSVPYYVLGNLILSFSSL